MNLYELPKHQIIMADISDYDYDEVYELSVFTNLRFRHWRGHDSEETIKSLGRRGKLELIEFKAGVLRVGRKK